MAVAAPSLVSAATPVRPWRWSQHWRDLLFVHWRVPSEALRPHLPASVEIDTFDGSAWVSAVAFRLHGVRPRWLPPVGFVSNTLELNLRTYVKHRGDSGIWFLSIHASNRGTVALARWFTPLPYVHAPTTYVNDRDSGRFDCGRSDGTPIFQADFQTTPRTFR